MHVLHTQAEVRLYKLLNFIFIKLILKKHFVSLNSMELIQDNYKLLKQQNVPVNKKQLK